MSHAQRVPEWAAKPFEDFRAFHGRTSDLLHLCREGIFFLGARPPLNDALNSVARSDDEKVSVQDEELAKRNAKLAESEGRADHPLLHAQAVILLWTGLEALVRDFFSTWLENVEAARSVETLRRTKVRLGEFESLAGSERYAFMLDALEETLGTRPSAGIERFETLFRTFGLSSSLPEGVPETLFELAHVRHLLVHRRGVADKRFAEALPRFGCEVGGEIRISHAHYHRYYDAVDRYVFELIQRLRAHFGLPPASRRHDCRFFEEGVMGV